MKKKFINRHEYPGGNKELKKFIDSNLRYPQQAFKKKIEGFVYLSYFINQQAEVTDVVVLKGLGYGCDEEAIRVVRMLKYPIPKNRGIKLKTKRRIKIFFRIKNHRINIVYNYVSKSKSSIQ